MAAGATPDRYRFDAGDDVEGIVTVPPNPCPGGQVDLLGSDGKSLGAALVCAGARFDLPGASRYELVVTGGDYRFTVDAAPRTKVADLAVGDKVEGELDEIGEQGLLSTCGEWSFKVVKEGPVEIRVAAVDSRVGEYSFRVEAG